MLGDGSYPIVADLYNIDSELEGASYCMMSNEDKGAFNFPASSSLVVPKQQIVIAVGYQSGDIVVAERRT